MRNEDRGVRACWTAGEWAAEARGFRVGAWLGLLVGVGGGVLLAVVVKL